MIDVSDWFKSGGQFMRLLFLLFLLCVAQLLRQTERFHTTPVSLICQSACSDILSELPKSFLKQKHRVWSWLQCNVVLKPFAPFGDSVFPFYGTTVQMQKAALHWPRTQSWSLCHALISLLDMFHCCPEVDRIWPVC